MLILAETAILSESLRVGGIYEKLNQNAKDIVDQKVINRSASLQKRNGEQLVGPVKTSRQY